MKKPFQHFFDVLTQSHSVRTLLGIFIGKKIKNYLGGRSGIRYRLEKVAITDNFFVFPYPLSSNSDENLYGKLENQSGFPEKHRHFTGRPLCSTGIVYIPLPRF